MSRGLARDPGDTITRRGPASRTLHDPPGEAATHQPDPALQTSVPVSIAPAPLFNFEGVDNVDGRPSARHQRRHRTQSLRAVVNSRSRFTAREPHHTSRCCTGRAAPSTLWTGFGGPCETRNDGDAIVLYDHLADRWVVSQLALPNLFFGIAVCAVLSVHRGLGRRRIRLAPTTGISSRSQTERLPKLGVWPDAYYMGINQFSAISLQFAGQGVIAFDRQKMLAGLPATMQSTWISRASTSISAGCCRQTSTVPPPPPGSPGYFVQVDDDACRATRRTAFSSGDFRELV